MITPPRILRFAGDSNLEVCLSVAAKTFGGGMIGGPLVLFTGPDNPDISVMKDYFTKSTDYDREFSDTGDGGPVSIFWNHGLDKTLKNARLTRGSLSLVTGKFLRENGYGDTTKAADDEPAAVWAKGVLDLANQYQRKIHGLVGAGKVCYSSGSVHHLVEREAKGGGIHEVKFWPIGEASLTPTPARPGVPVQCIKSLDELALDSEGSTERKGADLELIDIDSVIKSLESIAASGTPFGEAVGDALRWRLQRVRDIAASLLAESVPVGDTDAIAAAVGKFATIKSRIPAKVTK